MKAIVTLLLILCAPVYADLLVASVDEANLPYSISPRNYDNSERNYDNSVRNYDNSERNFNNTSRSWENSPRKFENTVRGNRSIVIKKGEKLIHIGYYATNEDGVTNFFSAEGKRLFFSPSGTMALFHSTNGHFCGAIGKIDGKTQLLLTDKGIKVLLLED